MTIVDVYLLLFLLLSGISLTFMAMRRGHILLRIASFLAWFSISVIFFTDSLGLSLDNTWTILLGSAFLLMAFFSLLMHMDTEIIKERRGQSWTEWGSKPRETESSYEAYRRQLQGRLRGTRRRRR